MNWAAQALGAVRRGEPTAMVTVVAAEGSTPREAGARMLVGARGQRGTIGGGNLEHLATDQARKLLAQDARGWALQDYPLGPLLQQCCGGHVRILLEKLEPASAIWLEDAAVRIAAGRAFTLQARFLGERLDRALLAEETQWPGLIEAPFALVDGDGNPLAGKRPKPSDGDALVERIDARRPRLVMFGAGHVGQAVARAFEPLPFRLDWFDNREAAAGPRVTIEDEARLIETAGAVGPGDFVLVLTHNHELDYRLVRAVLAGGGLRWLGLIGSGTKRARFVRRLREDGIAEPAIARLTCPIGIAGLKSKAPEVIAVAVAAELLQLSDT